MSTFTTVDIGRFTVGFDPKVLRSSSAIGVSLQSDVAKDLVRIAALLPGPPAVIIVEQTTNVTPQTGELGYTDPTTGQVLIQLDPNSQTTFSKTLAVWLPEALAHEVHHSVRTLTGPGFGNTLGAFLVSEGMASAFFHQAFPGTDAPWTTHLHPFKSMRSGTRRSLCWHKAACRCIRSGSTEGMACPSGLGSRLATTSPRPMSAIIPGRVPHRSLTRRHRPFWLVAGTLPDEE